jgi:ADP-heptose:LPS heptosyltransferase
LKQWLSKMVARMVRRPVLLPAQLHSMQPARILVVRQQNQMGDMVCATPVFRALAETFPQSRIALVTAPVNMEVVRHNPHLDQVFTFDQKMWRNPLRFLGLLGRLRQFNPEVTFVLSSVSFSVTSAALALVSGARYVVGADSLPFGHDISRHAFSLEMPSTPELDRHSVLHSLAPLQAIGITTDDLSTEVVPSTEEKLAAGQILQDLGLQPGFWALHPGAGKKQNIWPASGFARVARLAVEQGHQVLILHGPADAEPLAELKTLLDDSLGEKIQVAPPCSIGVGAALLQQADRFLCNDTGVMHVAGALPIPTVALFGPTDPELWKPPIAQVIALCSKIQTPDERGPEFGWMQNITSDEAWKAWTSLPGQSN